MLRADYFDGVSSQRHPVGLSLCDGEILIAGERLQKRYPLRGTDIGECVDGAAVILHFPDGASCEVADGPALERLVATVGRRSPLMQRIQRQGALALLALALFAGLGVAGYRWGLPSLAAALAPEIPQATTQRLGKLALTTMERGVLKPSRLGVEKQAAIRSQVALLANAGALPAHELLFRSAPGLGANAFALPGGTIVVTDRLVQSATDEQVSAVIGHELGHLAHHHPMRRLIQDAVVSVAAAAYFGDVSSAAASVSALALNSEYSREFEFAADRYAVERLRAAGLDPMALAVLLQKIDRGSAGGLLASHPDTPARIAEIRKFTETHPAPALASPQGQTND